MSFALAFWILMLVWLVFGLALHFGWAPLWGGSALLFVLLLLLGWKVFGPPLHG